jgi:hypothetical protein
VYSTLLFSPCYSNLLLRRRGWIGILGWGVLGYVLPRLSFLWCYGVFHCSIPLRVVLVFRDTIYVIIIILYSWYLVTYEHFWPYVWNNWSWVMHPMSTWFWHKNRVWHLLSHSNKTSSTATVTAMTRWSTLLWVTPMTPTPSRSPFAWLLNFAHTVRSRRLSLHSFTVWCSSWAWPRSWSIRSRVPLD